MVDAGTSSRISYAISRDYQTSYLNSTLLRPFRNRATFISRAGFTSATRQTLALSHKTETVALTSYRNLAG